jgi:hypothetical protein
MEGLEAMQRFRKEIAEATGNAAPHKGAVPLTPPAAGAHDG